jgi:hypothetical protein
MSQNLQKHQIFYNFLKNVHGKGQLFHQRPDESQVFGAEIAASPIESCCSVSGLKKVKK